MSEPRSLPLAGMRVLELTTAWAGPMLGRILAHFGAEVIKLETLDAIDNFRGAVTGDDRNRYPDREYGKHPYNRSAWFNTQNLGKLSLGIDLKAAESRDILARLIPLCDAVISNFAGGVLSRVGLDYESLRQMRGDIVLVEMVVTGRGGPLENVRGVGPTMEALAGMTTLTAYEDGIPQRTGPAYVDPIGALNAAAAILIALFHRRRTGEGQRIEVAQRESLMHWFGEWLLLYAEQGEMPAAAPNRAEGGAPHDAFRTRGEDEWIAIGVFSDCGWRALCAALGRPGLALDQRFSTPEARVREAAALHEELQALTLQHDKHELARHLQEHGICAAPVCTGKDLHDDPQLEACGFFLDVEHPEAGRRRYQGLPFAAAEGKPLAPAPLLGQHTESILKDLLGISDGRLKELLAREIIHQAAA